MHDARRGIPSVERLLSSDAFAPLHTRWPRPLVTSVLKQELNVLRSEVAGASDVDAPSAMLIAERVARSIENLAEPTLVPVINATGVVLHTNLGRAPLAQAALAAIAAVAGGYSTLEYDVATGARGSRYAHCRELIRRLTGAEDALVVNNNAAALVLALNTLARGLDVVVSRGELVEIGGAFRVPDIMARSGARLREVGSTNRTHAADYSDAIDERTGAVLKVHPSNFAMAGYTAEAGVAELAGIARGAGVPLIHDLGSGLLLEPARVGLPDSEPVPQSSLREGADVVTMSGDKLMGGPQCGIVLGSAELTERMRRNPLCRALRVDKLTLSALAATLRLHLEPERALREIPVLRMISLDPASIEARARTLADRCAAAGLDARVERGESAVGGGAAASVALPTFLVLVGRAGLGASELERRLRAATPPVIVRIVDDRAALDLRTVDPADDDLLAAALGAAASP